MSSYNYEVRIPASSLHMRRKILDYDAEVRSLALERTTGDQGQLEQPWGDGVGQACVSFRGYEIMTVKRLPGPVSAVGVQCIFFVTSQALSRS